MVKTRIKQLIVGIMVAVAAITVTAVPAQAYTMQHRYQTNYFDSGYPGEATCWGVKDYDFSWAEEVFFQQRDFTAYTYRIHRGACSPATLAYRGRLYDQHNRLK